MPKCRSGKINEEAVVSTQACIITRQKLKFWNVCIWILVSSPFSAPAQGRKMLGAAWTEMNHSLVSAVFPVGLAAARPSATSPERFWGACALWTEQTLSTPCSPQARFILHPKDLNFLEDFYLFCLLRTAVIPTGVWGSRKKINKCFSVSPVFIYFHFNFPPNEAFLFHLAVTLS